MARGDRDAGAPAGSPSGSPENWLTVVARITTLRDGVVGEVVKPGAAPCDLVGETETDVRVSVLEEVREFARYVGRPVRLRVTDSEATWPLVVDPDGRPPVLDDGPDYAHTTGSAPAPLRTVDRRDRGEEQRRREQPGEASAAIRFLADVRRPLITRAQWYERRLDAELDQRREMRHPNRIAVLSLQGGTGKTTLSVVLGDLLARSLPGDRICAIDLHPGSGVLSLAATGADVATGTMLDLHRELDSVRAHRQLQQYVASLPSGLDVLPGPRDLRSAQTMTAEHYRELFAAVLDEAYSVMVLDSSPDLTSTAAQLAIERATQLVVVSGQGDAASAAMRDALPFLLSLRAAGRDGRAVTVAINSVVSDRRAGSARAVREEVRSVNASIPVIEVPMDLALRAEISAGSWSMERIERRWTRIPLKEIALEVMGRLV